MKRLLQELKQIKSNPSQDTHLEPISDSLLEWKASIKGTGLYSSGTFELSINLHEYPMHPPKIHFTTPICHPNIHFKTGEICLSILKDEWVPTYTLESILKAIQLLLEEPNYESPLNCDVTNLKNDQRAYRSLIQMYVKLYACKESISIN